MNRFELSYLPAFKKGTKSVFEKGKPLILPERNIVFDDRILFPSFVKSPPRGFVDIKNPKPLEIEIKKVDTDIWKKVENLIGKSIGQQIEGLKELKEEKVNNPEEEKQKEQAIGAVSLDLLENVEDLTDKQIEQIAENTTELKINENPLEEGLTRFIDKEYLDENPGAKQKIALWVLSQAKKTNTDILKPIVGVQGRNIALRNVFMNLANPKFNHSLDLIEGKMVRSSDLEDELNLKLPDFGLGELSQV